MVPLSAVIRSETEAAPIAIEQFNQLNSASISGLPIPGVATAPSPIWKSCVAVPKSARIG